MEMFLIKGKINIPAFPLSEDSAEFREMRRQKFLNKKSFEKTTGFFRETVSPGLQQELRAPENDAHGRSLVSSSLANYVFRDFLLRYSAGESLDDLRGDFTRVVAAFEDAAKYYREYSGKENSSIFGFQEIDDFEQVMQMIGLAILLHRRELIPRIHALIANSAYDGQDAMYEELVSHDLENRPFLDSWYHDLPYLHLLNATDEESAEGKIAEMQQYLKVWYKSMKNAPWHDCHLKMNDEGCAGYFGYWAIEAGAIAYLYKINDSSFRDNIVYPKDLVDYARKLDQETQAAPSEALSPKHNSQLMRIEGGQPCPETGYWFTPAKKDSRRHFNQGEIMPVFEGSQYGATIWQWSPDQEGYAL